MAKISKKAGEEAFRALVNGTPAARKSRRWSDLKKKLASPERIARAEAEAEEVARAIDDTIPSPPPAILSEMKRRVKRAKERLQAVAPRTKDGRAISEEQAREIDVTSEMVAEWLEHHSDACQSSAMQSARTAASSRDYEDALRLKNEADILRRMAREAGRGRFLPPELQPCIDGAGNRGSHLNYVKSNKTSGGRVCTFCGRK